MAKNKKKGSAKKTERVRQLFVLPICLLLFNAFEEIVIYKLDQWFPNRYHYVALIVITFAIGFGVVGELFSKYISNRILDTHKTTAKNSGWTGLVIFYATIFFLIYILYYQLYVHSVGSILPAAWR